MPSNCELASVTRRDLFRMAVAGSVTLGLGVVASGAAVITAAVGGRVGGGDAVVGAAPVGGV